MRVAKWAGMVVCVLIFCSGWCVAEWQGHGWGVRIGRGALQLERGNKFSEPVWWDWGYLMQPSFRWRFESDDSWATGVPVAATCEMR